MENKLNLNIVTYNCKHLGVTKHKYIQYLLCECDVLLLQEHCLFTSQFSRFNELGVDISFTASSGMDETCPLVGRPFGGTGIIWKANIKNRVDIVKCISNRLCAVVIHVNADCTLLLFYVYMPCDDRTEGVNVDIFRSVLDEILMIYHRINPTHVLVGGDFNTDFTRSSPHTRELNQFMESEGLSCPSRDNTDYCIDFTFSGPNGTALSVIDHVLFSNLLNEFLIEYKVMPSIDNLSDHVGLLCSLCFPVDYCRMEKREFKNNVCWGKATEADIECC